MSIKLTIGIPSIPERSESHLAILYKKLSDQIGDSKDIEIVSIMDNKTMSVGRKRTLLFHIAQGKYTCLIDDDDDITDDFIQTLRAAITDDLNVDVICYNQEANINGRIWTIRTSLNNNKVLPFDQLMVDQYGRTVDCNRPPWHWCAWRTDLVRNIPFGDSNTQEDTIFVVDAISKAKTQLVLDRILCKYKWFPEVSAAQFQSISLDSISKAKI